MVLFAANHCSLFVYLCELAVVEMSPKHLKVWLNYTPVASDENECSEVLHCCRYHFMSTGIGRPTGIVMFLNDLHLH